MCVWIRAVVCLATIAAGGNQSWSAETATGWRGNGTGLWPDARTPLHWSRLPQGALEGARTRAEQPPGNEPGDAPRLQKGLPAEWLVLGPLEVKDSVENFDDELLPNEVGATPVIDAPAAGQAWRRLVARWDDPMVFGTAELPWVQILKAAEFQPNRLAYAHTWIYSQRGGPTRLVVDHGFGCKIWVNGEPVYRSPQRHTALGYYTSISRCELEHTQPQSGRADFSLKPGWNRLLVKVSSSNKNDFAEMQFCLRLMDPPTVSYAETNIRWQSELPNRSTSTPILVGDRIFVAAEPDLLVCLDKHSGQQLWSAATNYYEALTPAERNAEPRFAAEVDPLVAALAVEKDRDGRIELRRQIQEALIKIDAGRFQLQNDGHFAAHFGIVGFSMPTPVSDGQYVYLWNGLGVAACYDLAGHRQWITRVPVGELAYGSSPALADGVLAVFLGKLYGLDAKTGELRWTQPRISKNIAAVLAASLNQHPVFISYLGEVIRPSDGKLLYRPREATSGDSGSWGPPVALGSKLYVPKYGIHHLTVLDFRQASEDRWQPEVLANVDQTTPPEISHRPDGSWLDRSTAGSPLVYDGLVYTVDIYGWLYVFDLATQQTVYFKDLGVSGLMHYNAVPVAASATLVGKNIVVVDNQGTALVLASGREFKILAKNQIETQLDRPWPVPAQETLAYAPPIVDDDRLYLRGERYLYCIAAPEK